MFLLSSVNNFLLHVVGEERVLHQSIRMGSSPSCVHRYIHVGER